MILGIGTKVLIAHRRLFEGDHGRYFVGVIEGYEAGIARVDGYSWSRDGYDGTYHRKEDLRTKIVSITSGSVICYQLPSNVHLDSFRIVTKKTKILACDDREFEMDLSEGVLHKGNAPRSKFGRVG